MTTKQLSKHTLKQYFNKSDLCDQLELSPQLSFHWSNWDQSCLIQRKKFRNFSNKHQLDKLNLELLELKKESIWLCNKLKVVKSDLFSLYESYVDSRLRLTWFERENEILFSKDGEQGPYFSLTSMKWFQQEIHKKFILRKILVESYTLRSFRLDGNIPVHFRLNNDVTIYRDNVSIHQISEVGFILKIKDKKFLNKIKTSNMIDIDIPIIKYKEVRELSPIETFKKLNEDSIESDLCLTSFKLDSRILNFYGNLNNAKRSSAEEFYLFARFDDFLPDGHDLELKKIFKPLVEKTKMLFSKSIEEEFNQVA